MSTERKKVRIDISRLEKKEREKVAELEEFLKERFGEVERAKSEFRLEVEAKRRVRNSLRKFLYRSGLKEDFRVIAGERDVLIIKERRQR